MSGNFSLKWYSTKFKVRGIQHTRDKVSPKLGQLNWILGRSEQLNFSPLFYALILDQPAFFIECWLLAESEWIRKCLFQQHIAILYLTYMYIGDFISYRYNIFTFEHKDEYVWKRLCNPFIRFELFSAFKLNMLFILFIHIICVDHDSRCSTLISYMITIPLVVLDGFVFIWNFRKIQSTPYRV